MCKFPRLSIIAIIAWLIYLWCSTGSRFLQASTQVPKDARDNGLLFMHLFFTPSDVINFFVAFGTIAVAITTVLALRKTDEGLNVAREANQITKSHEEKRVVTSTLNNEKIFRYLFVRAFDYIRMNSVSVAPSWIDNTFESVISDLREKLLSADSVVHTEEKLYEHMCNFLTDLERNVRFLKTFRKNVHDDDIEFRYAVEKNSLILLGRISHVFSALNIAVIDEDVQDRLQDAILRTNHNLQIHDALLEKRERKT